MRIPYSKPSITEDDVALVTRAARDGWGERCYEFIEEFETRFADFCGSSYAIATSSCTGALHLGLAALGIGPSDEVILADTNWIATVAPIVHLGATPVFVDIEPDYWCIDPNAVRSRISSRTRAIVVTHLYGNVADLEQLSNIALEFNIPLVEDSAEAIGAQHHGRPTGGIGTFGVFSFHGTKTITTGEGGMLVTSDADLYERVLTLSNHGRSRSQLKQFWPDLVGYKFKMSNIQAALGCSQLRRINELVERKGEIMMRYRERLGSVAGIELNLERPRCSNAWWMPTIVWPTELGVHRDDLRQALVSRGIDARVFFPALSSLPMFQPIANPHANSLPARAINLPSFHDISSESIDEVCDVVLAVLTSLGT